VVWFPSALQLVQCFLTVVGHVDGKILLAEHRQDHSLVHCVVLHEKQPRLFCSRHGGWLVSTRLYGRRLGFRCLERYLHNKRTPSSYAALHANLSSLQFHQPLRDGQPQASTAVLTADAGIGLREFFKNERN